MGVSESKEDFSDKVINDLINKITDFLEEKNIEMNQIHGLHEGDKNLFIQKFNDVINYLSTYIINNEHINDLLKFFQEDFDDEISIDKSLIKNRKKFMSKKESIKNLIDEEEELLQFLNKFKYIYENKDLIFKSEIEDSNDELKNSFNYVFSYMKKKNDDMNVMDKTVKDFNNSLCTKISTKVLPLLENMVQSEKINNQIDKLNKKFDFKREQCKKILSSLKNIKPENFTKDDILILKKATELSNDMSKFQSEKKLLQEKLNKIANEHYNRCTPEQQELIEKYKSGEITKEEFKKIAYQKPLDEIDDIKYENEFKRIIEIYNNSSKINEDKKKIVTAMEFFIKTIDSLTNDNPSLNVFNDLRIPSN